MVAPSTPLQDMFDAVVDLSPDEQSAYIESHCTDPATRHQLERLIRDDRARPDGFLDSPVPGAVGEGLGLARGTLLGERYRVQEIIGEGGMGVVYRAEQLTPLTREVAVKVLRPGMDTQRVISRFEAERQTLARMSHPGIARVFDAGVTPDGRPYFVMELVAGRPITGYCAERGLDARARIELVLRVCKGVQHAHTRGVIHRDLKPANILVTDEGGPIVIDFGVAKALGDARSPDQAVTEHGQLIGTPECMSPEQADLLAADADTRTDVYSLGAILYHVLTGVPPFDVDTLRGRGFAEAQRVIREVDPSRISDRVAGADPALASRLRGDLDWIVSKAVEKDPERRYQSAAELGDDLRRYLASEPVLARPPSWRYRTRRFVRRNRGLVYGGAAAGVAVVVGLASTGTLAVRESRHRNTSSRRPHAVAKRYHHSFGPGGCAFVQGFQ